MTPPHQPAGPPDPPPDNTRPAWLVTPRSLAILAIVFLAWATLAELLTTYTDPRLGLAAHCLLLGGLLVASTRTHGRSAWAFLVSLAFGPLIRILSLSLPLTHFPILYWYVITSVPLFAAIWVAGRSLGYSWRALGLNLRTWPLQLAISLTGLAFGAGEYYILRPEPLASALVWQEFWPAALILLVCTGLLEEMIFRGLLQRSAGDTLGRWAIPYVALLFAVLHLGYQSLVDVAFVLIVGLFFGWAVDRTRSLIGVTLAHGLTNIMLFLIMPFLVA
ncbi:MAG: CPBP family intramembrane glutamic endopeptidase [Anaerolineae bacterium]